MRLGNFQNKTGLMANNSGVTCGGGVAEDGRAVRGASNCFTEQILERGYDRRSNLFTIRMP